MSRKAIEDALEEEEFPEQEEDFEEPQDGGEFDEEEALPELVVIDDELITHLQQDIPKGKPKTLLQGMDVIFGALKMKDNIILDEELTVDPLTTILIPLLETVYKIYTENQNKANRKHKETDKMLVQISQIFNAFNNFKDSAEKLRVYCQSLFILKDYIEPENVSSSLTKAAKTCFTNDDYIPVIQEAFENFVQDPHFSHTIFNIQYNAYIQAVNKTHDEVFEKLLPGLIEFYMKDVTKSTSFVKGLIKLFASKVADAMTRTDKAIISWNTLGILEFISAFTLEANEKRFVFPIMDCLLGVMRHFPIAHNLPFLLRIARIAHRITSKFSVKAPLLSWTADAMKEVCNQQCKPGNVFNWEDALIAPKPATYEYVEEAFARLSKLLMVLLNDEAENIAFPEYASFIRRKLEDITTTARNNRMRAKPKALIKTISEQQSALSDIKRGLEWNTRQEQISAWLETIKDAETPLKTLLAREESVDSAIREMKAPKAEKEKAPDETFVDKETGDVLQIATVDDI